MIIQRWIEKTENIGRCKIYKIEDKIVRRLIIVRILIDLASRELLGLG
jgi:hypothetical protein